jgi:tetratricopeptide (TPR) repeat protein/predicted Ser/Thr protein kinase
MSADDDLELLMRRGLPPRYEILRAIGRGGMAVVYLATDKRYDRHVAVKVLRPELAGLVGAARFLREISVVAHLEHPHIVSLYDSGEIDGIPYYIMSYVEGEPLDSLLQREKQLPIDQAVEITCQVAAALHYAHDRGVIHRDVKPQNVLLSHGQALVADFGVAVAFEGADTEHLTGTGMAVGSPEYMSPEQGAGSDELDRRSDIYSLGCVLYELLIGQPPFTARTPQAVIARHNMAPVPDLRIVRNTIPPDMERVVKKALAKVPADRFRTAAEFAEALRRSLEPRRSFQRPSRLGRQTVRRVAIATPVIALVAVAAVLSWATQNSRRSRPPGRLVAVLPFHFSGTVDSSVITPPAVVTLLSGRLFGTDVMEGIDPELVLRRVREAGRQGQQLSERDALAIARKLGADAALVGRIHGTTARLLISGSLISVRDGKTLHRVDGVSGPPDSVEALLDRVTIPLLLQRVGEGWRRPEELTSGNPDAVKSFVQGLERYRRGRYAAAVEAFEHALRVDPQFTLARIRLGIAHRDADNVESSLATLEGAWLARDRLVRIDSILLLALLGDRHPAPTSHAQQLRKWEWIVDSLPMYWEGVHELGVMLMRWGPMVGKETPHARARVAFQQALNADSAFAPALEHLIELAAMGGDTAEVRRLSHRHVAANPLADHRDYVRWRRAIALGAVRARDSVRTRFSEVPRNVLEQIVGTAQLDGVAFDDATAAVAELRRRARNDYDLWQVDLIASRLALNRGRRGDVPHETPEDLFTLPLNDFYRVVEALFWSGERDAGERRVRAWVETVDSPVVGDRGASSRTQMARCAVSLWRVAHKQIDGVAKALERLRAVRGAGDQRVTMYLPLCTATLDAAYAALSGDPAAARARERLDTLLRSAPITNGYIQLAARMTLADLYERNGDLESAVRVVSQRPYEKRFGTVGLSDMLLREGQLAARLGDTARTVSALDHFLRLRADAEPPFDRQRDSLRTLVPRFRRDSAP